MFICFFVLVPQISSYCHRHLGGVSKAMYPQLIVIISMLEKFPGGSASPLGTVYLFTSSLCGWFVGWYSKTTDCILYLFVKDLQDLQAGHSAFVYSMCVCLVCGLIFKDDQLYFSTIYGVLNKNVSLYLFVLYSKTTNCILTTIYWVLNKNVSLYLFVRDV